jgi:hypothetical protein
MEVRVKSLVVSLEFSMEGTVPRPSHPCAGNLTLPLHTWLCTLHLAWCLEGGVGATLAISLALDFQLGLVNGGSRRKSEKRGREFTKFLQSLFLFLLFWY